LLDIKKEYIKSNLVLYFSIILITGSVETMSIPNSPIIVYYSNNTKEESHSLPLNEK
jgi:hypothetical protein